MSEAGISGGSRGQERFRASNRAVRQASLRAHNLTLVLREVLAAPTPVSRADISAATGLTRATVSALVERLLAAKFLAELDPVAGQRAGRPAIPLVPARSTIAAIGMEINVDYLGVCALDIAGEILVEHIAAGDFRNSDPAAVVGRLASVAGSVLSDLTERGVAIAGTALALPGLVDEVTGPLRLAPNLGWRDVDVVALIAQHPVVAQFPPLLGNEADLAAIAEARARARTGPDSFVYVSGEVGVGGAIVLDGRLFRGAHGWSGEIGHVALGSDGDLGQGGPLEAYAGQDAMFDAAGMSRTASVADLLAGGDRAQAALDRAADALGVVLSGVMNVVDVHQVVLGGVFAELTDRLSPRVIAQLERRVIAAPWAGIGVERSVGGRHPAMYGGALSVLDLIIEDPGQWFGADEGSSLDV